MAEHFAFLRGKKKENPQVELTETTKKKKYDILAALSKALLVFMLSFGAVGGFLSAYDMDYNRLICGAAILGLSMLLCLIYETGRKWFTNLCVIGIFLIYAYVAVSQFWILNSGAYAVINQMYEAAQSYLGIVGGGLYSLRVEDTYQTVTAIAIFVGVVLDILFVLRLQYKASLPRTVLMTFTLYLVPIYFERTPELFYLFLLLAGYVAIGILQCGNVRTHISGQVRYALLVGMVVSAAVVLLFGALLPKVRYRGMVPKNASKAESEGSAVLYAQYGVMALLMNQNAGGGLNEGRLLQNISVTPNNETDLIVRYTPYSMEPVYLKAYTGLRYDGSRWTDASQNQDADIFLSREGRARRKLYEQDSSKQSRGIMEVINVDPNIEYVFWPYYTDTESVQRMETDRETGLGVRYTYYPVVSDAILADYVGGEVDEAYLEVPAVCRNAVQKACKAAGLSGTPEQIAAQIFRYFSTEFSYTLRPGFYFGGMDYISYFLERNKKGFCTHFASAGTMLFRSMGIPARYVEGYVFTYTDVVTDGEILENEAYEDYYDGYSPLGETALVEVEVPDAQAHAWVEIYLPDRGWTLVDVTPAASLDEEETESFWDAILSGSARNRATEDQAQEAADYLENALTGGAGIVGILLAAVIAFWVTRWCIIRYREAKLPGAERVKLEYGRMTDMLKEREETFAVLTTPEEELNWIREWGHVEVPESLQKELYQIFFGPEQERDYEEIRRQLIRIRRTVRRNRSKS